MPTTGSSPRGSYLVISHATDEGVPAEIADTLAQLKSMRDTSSSPVIWRSHTQIADLFGDVNGTRKLTPWRQLNFDPLHVS